MSWDSYVDGWYGYDALLGQELMQIADAEYKRGGNWPGLQPRDTGTLFVVAGAQDCSIRFTNKVIYITRNEGGYSRFYETLKRLQCEHFEVPFDGELFAPAEGDLMSDNRPIARGHAEWLWSVYRNKHLEDHPYISASRLMNLYGLLCYQTLAAQMTAHRIAEGVWPVFVADMLRDFTVSRPQRALIKTHRVVMGDLIRSHPAPGLHRIMDPPTYQQLVSTYQNAIAGFERRRKSLEDVIPMVDRRFQRSSNKQSAAALVGIKEILELIVVASAAFDLCKRVFDGARDAWNDAARALEHEREIRDRMQESKPIPGAEDHIDSYERNRDALAGTC